MALLDRLERAESLLREVASSAADTNKDSRLKWLNVEIHRDDWQRIQEWHNAEAQDD